MCLEGGRGEPGSSGGWWAAGTHGSAGAQEPALAFLSGRCAPLLASWTQWGLVTGLRGLGAFRRFLLCLVFDCELPMLFSQSRGISVT